MSRVIFEFDDVEDMDAINLLVNRHKILGALYAIRDLRSVIYNGKLYNGELISVKDNKVLTNEDYEKYQELGDYPVSNTKGYVDRDYIENELGVIVDEISMFLD